MHASASLHCSTESQPVQSGMGVGASQVPAPHRSSVQGSPSPQLASAARSRQPGICVWRQNPGSSHDSTVQTSSSSHSGPMSSFGTPPQSWSVPSQGSGAPG